MRGPRCVVTTLALAALLLLACDWPDDGESSPDASRQTGPGKVSLLFPNSPYPYIPGLEIRVDGTSVVPGQLVEAQFETQDQMANHKFQLELWVQGGPLLKKVLQSPWCADFSQPVVEEWMSFCSIPALRPSTSSCQFYSGAAGVSDGTCSMCNPYPDGSICPEACKVAILSATPLYFETVCTEPGFQQLGEGCERRADGIDNCVEGSVCVGGTCEALCEFPCEVECPGLPRYLPSCDVDTPLGR